MFIKHPILCQFFPKCNIFIFSKPRINQIMQVFHGYITEERQSLDLVYVFKVVTLVSSGVGIWMWVFLRPTPNNTLWDVTGLKKSELGFFPSTANNYLKIWQRKETQPPASVLLSGLWSHQDPGNQMKSQEKWRFLYHPWPYWAGKDVLRMGRVEIQLYSPAATWENDEIEYCLLSSVSHEYTEEKKLWGSRNWECCSWYPSLQEGCPLSKEEIGPWDRWEGCKGGKSTPPSFTLVFFLWDRGLTNQRETISSHGRSLRTFNSYNICHEDLAVFLHERGRISTIIAYNRMIQGREDSKISTV